MVEIEPNYDRFSRLFELYGIEPGALSVYAASDDNGRGIALPWVKRTSAAPAKVGRARRFVIWLGFPAGSHARFAAAESATPEAHKLDNR